MLERVSERKDSTAAPGNEGEPLEALRRQIEDHRKADAGQSYVGRAISSFWRDDEESLESLERLYEDAERKQKAGDTAGLEKLRRDIDQQIKSDREALSWQSEINHYGGGFLKVAGLFARGRLGLAGTVAIYALDQMNPGDSFRTQMADAVLGGSKGGLLKGTFHFLGSKPVGIAAKGVGLGVSSRVLELGLTRSTYIDAATGNVDMSKGLGDVVRGSLNKTALAADIVIFGAAHGMLGQANRLTAGAIEKSPLLSTMLTGTTFGLSAGATGEVLRQQHAGEQFDLGKIVKRSLIQGAIDTVAAAPGGIQADAHFRGQVAGYTRRATDNMRLQAEQLRSSVQNMADMLSLDGGLTPALAGVPGGRMPIGIRLPRPTRSAGPDRLMMAMNDGPTPITSGASLEGVLGGSKPGEGALTGGKGGQKGIVGPEVPEPVNPVERSGAGPKVENLSGTDKSEPAGTEKVAPGIEKAPEVSPETRTLFEEFARYALGASKPGAGAVEKQQLFEFLSRNRDLEGPIREYEAMTFESLTTKFQPGQFSPEQIAQQMQIVKLVGEFYRPERPRIFVDNVQQYQAFQGLQQAFNVLNRNPVDPVATKAVYEILVQTHPHAPGYENFHEHVKQYAASTPREAEVVILDRFFRTNFLTGLKRWQTWRSGLEGGLEPLETGPRIVESTKPVPERTAAETSAKADEVAGKETVAREETTPPAVESEAASALAALGKAKPIRAAGEGSETGTARPVETTGEAAQSGAARPKPVAPESVEEAPQVKPPVMPPSEPGTVTASELAKGLADASPAVRRKTARILGDHLSKLSDAEFNTWKTVAEDVHLLGHLLRRADVEAIPPAVLKRFLSKQSELTGVEPVKRPGDANPAEVRHPEWAVEHVERSQRIAEMKARESGRPPRPPREPREPRDSMDDRLSMLEKTLEAFKDSPEVAVKLLELGATDRATLEGLFFSFGHPKFGEAYKNLVKRVTPDTESMEPLKYLIQFIKDGNSEGALAALQQMRPATRADMAEIEARIEAEKWAELEDGQQVDLALVKQEAEAAYRAEVQKTEARWLETRKLVNDIITGNVPQPPRGRDGGRGFGGGRGGPPRGPRQ